MHLIFSFIFSILLTPSLLYASACCSQSAGGGKSLILGDEKWKVGLESSLAKIHTDVGASGAWVDRQENESVLTTAFNATLASPFEWERGQIGVSLPFISRSRASESQAGLSDIGLLVGYEVIPNWYHKNWIPQWTTALSLNIPTGHSLFNSQKPYTVDRRGLGVWALTCSQALLIKKSWGTISFNLDLTQTAPSTTQSGDVDSFTSSSMGLGYGFDFASVDFNIGLSHSYDTGNRITKNGVTTTSEASQWQTLALGISKSISGSSASDMTQTVSLQYANQSWIGDPVNTSLGDSWSASFTSTWPR